MFSVQVMALLALLVRSSLSHSFSWDIVVGDENRLDFYYNGTLTHTEEFPYTRSTGHRTINSVTYDPVNYRVLFSDHSFFNVTISSFDLSTKEIQTLVTRIYDGKYLKFVYDPVTQLLFWEDGMSIYSFSLNPASSNKTVDGNLLVTMDPHWSSRDIAVDSCAGYIYWATKYTIERVRFDGSEKKVLRELYVNDLQSLVFDPQTQKLYWTEKSHNNGETQLIIKSSDFKGKDRTIIEINETDGYSLAVSKDFIYWKNYMQVGIWQAPKIPSEHADGKLLPMSSSDCWGCKSIAAYYTIEEQTQGAKNCEALKSLIPNDSKHDSTVSICQNYCLQGNCSVSAEGQPTCSCKAGYSGEKCEVDACYKHCLNNGVCSLNDEDEAVCECTADYEGVRCDVAITHSGVHAENTTSQVLLDLQKEVRKVIKEELKHVLQFFSDNIDEYQAKI